jgi:metallopeptidase family M12-like protein
MLRPLHALLAGCCLLALPLACSEETIIVKKAPEGSPSGTTAGTETQKPPAPPPPAPKSLVVDLGTVKAGVDVPFDVPEGALGFNIVMEGKSSDFDPDRPFGIERITSPTGKVVHDKFMPVGGTKPTSIAAFDVIAAASVPQSEAAPESLTGKWKVRFGVYQNATAKPSFKAKVRIQSSGDGEFHGGKLDLHLHLPSGVTVGGSAVDPAKAETNPAIKDRVDTFFEVTSKLLGIERGEVKYHAEPATLAKVDGQAILDGFAVSAGEKEGTQAFHILLTDSISNNGQPFAKGIAPGIPGAAGVFGRGVSGIIVATADSQGVEDDVLTMVHETGHFFGLNHTTEFDGQSSDPLKDTPACTTIADGQLQTCPDKGNIMFPAGAIAGPVTLSPTQQRVYRGSPIYKALAAGASNTQSKPLGNDNGQLRAMHRTFRTSGMPLTPLESELSLGMCGQTPIDQDGLVKRFGRGSAIAQLRAAAADQDLSPIIRGRATIALQRLGEQP